MSWRQRRDHDLKIYALVPLLVQTMILLSCAFFADVSISDKAAVYLIGAIALGFVAEVMVAWL
jgi:hypothetical protein